MRQENNSSLQPFRAEDWWKSKAALLMGFVYLYGLWFNISFEKFIPLSILSILEISGFASFGYLINDYFDQEKDFIAGKKNFLLNKSILMQVSLILTSLFLIALPWIYLPTTRLSYSLIFIEFLLFFIYSCPPIRFKERGIWGVIIDALYAHTLPTLLAAYTFLLASSSALPIVPFVLLFIWQLANGIRNILLHQLEDKGKDIFSATNTFIKTIALQDLRVILVSVLLMEMISSLSFFIVLTTFQFWFCGGIIIISVLYFIAFREFSRLGFEKILHATLRYFPNSIYEKWLPILYLLILSCFNCFFLAFLFLHIAIFNFNLYQQVAKRIFLLWKMIPFNFVYYHILIPIRIFISSIVNHSIYYFFLLFSINLKKENLSAWEYFKLKRRK